MEEKNIFVNAEGAFKAIGDAIAYLGDNGYVDGIFVLRPTKKSGVSGMLQMFVGTKLDVVACLIMAAVNSKNIKDVIMKAGRIIAERWEEMVIECELQEEAADE